MEKLTITPATEADIPAVADILTDATTYKVEHGDMAWGTGGWSHSEVEDSNTEGTTYLVHDGGELVGTVALQDTDERSWGEQPPDATYLHRLAFGHDFHGRGLGEQVIGWAAEMATLKGHQFLRLDCDARNTSLCAYYERQGFVKVGTKEIPEYKDYVAALYQKAI